MQSWGGREPRAGAGPLAPRFQLATPGRPEQGRGRFVQRRRHPIGGPIPGEPAGSLTCRHPGFPRPAPSWEARPPGALHQRVGALLAVPPLVRALRLFPASL